MQNTDPGIMFRTFKKVNLEKESINKCMVSVRSHSQDFEEHILNTLLISQLVLTVLSSVQNPKCSCFLDLLSNELVKVLHQTTALC